jgi:MtrB/PioB family decaheme-associated outer membrane protein
MTKRNYSPLRRPTRIALAVCAALAAVGEAALAEPMQQVTLYRNADMSRWSDNYVEFGVVGNSAIDVGTPNSSFKFGEFSGLKAEGIYGTLGFNWITRDPENDAKYSQVYGENVGLASKFLLEAGEQGRWKMNIGLDRLTRYETDSAKFIHQGLGTDSLTLPGFTRVANATLVPPATFSQYDIQQTREIYRLGFGGVLSSNWDYKVSFREDRREGTRLTGITFNQALVVPYPIDDHTQQMEAALSYASKVAQLQLGYTFSRFENTFSSFNVANPYSAPATSVVGRMSLMPDNDYHQVNAIGAYNFTRATRLQMHGSYAVGRQRDTFVPYSANLADNAVGNVPPVSSLNGKVVNSLLDLVLTTRPNDKSNLKFGYQHRDNDNQTPVTTFLYLSRDTTTPAVANSANTRTNVPISTTEQKLVVDGDYEIARRTLLRAELENRRVNYQLTDRTYTNTAKATFELRRPVSDEFLGNLGYIYTQRTGSDYDKSVFFRSSYTNPTFYSTTLVDNHPSLRSYMYSDFKENRVRAAGTWTADETVSVQGSIDGYRQRFLGADCNEVSKAIVAVGTDTQLPDTCLGRTQAEGASAHIDLQWQPEENVSTFAFGDIAQTIIDQRGRPWLRNNGSGANTALDYFDTLTYRDIAVGLGVKWQPEKWDVGAQYVFNRGIGKSEISLASGATAVPVPDTETRTHSVQLYAKWNYSKQVAWRFNYWIERMMSSDWAYGLAPTAAQNVLLTGQTAPNYWNHVLGVSVAFQSW